MVTKVAYQVLVVDDELEIREALAIYLQHEGLQAHLASNGIEALEILQQEAIQLIIMDVMMPQLDGIQATHKIRAERDIPIIMLSAKAEDTDKILGLNFGADDYVTKPFNPLELMARVRSQLRRFARVTAAAPPQEDELRVRGLVLNKRMMAVEADGEEVRLTPTEFKILELLMGRPGQVFSIEQIYDQVWNEPGGYGADNTVAVHVRRIREKIELNAKDPKYLKVVWGIGYKIEK